MCSHKYKTDEHATLSAHLLCAKCKIIIVHAHKNIKVICQIICIFISSLIIDKPNIELGRTYIKKSDSNSGKIGDSAD